MRWDNVKPLTGSDQACEIAFVIAQIRLYHDGVRWPRLRATGRVPPAPPPGATESEIWDWLIATAPDPCGEYHQRRKQKLEKKRKLEEKETQK